MEIIASPMQALSYSEKCLPNLRWVPVSMLQPRQKLQQCWEITEYRDGSPYAIRRQWRDVPETDAGS